MPDILSIRGQEEVPVGTRVVAESLTAPNPATRGYRLHHAMLRINDAEKSLRFYIDLLGMSLIFTFNTGPFVVYYLGYPGPDDQAPADIARSMSSRAGFLELVHVPSKHRQSEADTGAGVPVDRTAFTGFGHLGFYVPSVDDALKRATASGYTVIKACADVSPNVLELPEYLSNIPPHPAFLGSLSQVGFIKDPDGHSIELLPAKWQR